MDLASIAQELDSRERSLMLELGTETVDAIKYLAVSYFSCELRAIFHLRTTLLMLTSPAIFQNRFYQKRCNVLLEFN